MVKVQDSDIYTLTNVTRDTTGEYKCSLVDNAKMEASANITVNCKQATKLLLLFITYVFKVGTHLLPE